MSSQHEISRRDFLAFGGKLAMLALINSPIIGSLGREHSRPAEAYPLQEVRREPQLVVPLKFAGNDTEPVSRRNLEALYGPDSLMEKYFREVSYFAAGGGITLAGTRVLDWLNLPGSRADYDSNANDFRLLYGNIGLDAIKLLKETHSADELLNFRGFQFVVNASDFSAACMPGFYFDLEGQEVRSAATILGAPDHLITQTIAHEMGHELADLRHHHNPWDPMSSEYNCNMTTDPSLCEAPHYNAYNKWKLGIIGEDLIYRLGSGLQKVRLNSISDLPEPGYKKMVYVTSQVGADLVVEVRHSKGFDVNLPNYSIAESVILVYKVFSLGEEPLLLVDKNKDGNLGDQGVMWLEGERFIGANWDPDWKGIDFTIESLENGRAELEFNISSQATILGPTPTPVATLDPKETRKIFLPVTIRNSLTPFKINK